MITGIGIDIVKVSRFSAWIKAPYSHQRTIFSEQEIADSFTRNAKEQCIIEHLAARFAAKEAFYKALSATLTTLNITPKHQFSLVFSAQHTSVTTGNLGAPQLIVAWDSFIEKIGSPLPALTIHLSLSHEKTHAVAFIIISLQA